MYIGNLDIVTIFYSLIIFLTFLLLKNFATKLIIKFSKKISERYKCKTFALMADTLEKPLNNFFTYTGIYCALYILPLSSGLYALLYKIFRTCIVITVTQCILNIVTAYAVVLNSNVINQEGKPPVLKTLFPILYKVIKVLIVILAVIIIAAEFDFKQLNSILAGIGIGGAAIALASQVGDYISVDSNEGTVEELGFRSTKIRTLEQELIVVPNSKFTDRAVINYSKRNLRRASFRVGATYDTQADKLKNLITKIKDMLDEHPMVKENSSLVRFDKFGPNSLEILVQYLINTGDYELYMNIKDEINFKIMDLFEREGVSFALPSMSIYMEKN